MKGLSVSNSRLTAPHKDKKTVPQESILDYIHECMRQLQHAMLHFAA